MLMLQTELKAQTIRIVQQIDKILLILFYKFQNIYKYENDYQYILFQPSDQTINEAQCYFQSYNIFKTLFSFKCSDLDLLILILGVVNIDTSFD
ncbi:hypothetical protein pb186bvf_000033 [Paramecium bursaria]